MTLLKEKKTLALKKSLSYCQGDLKVRSSSLFDFDTIAYIPTEYNAVEEKVTWKLPKFTISIDGVSYILNHTQVGLLKVINDSKSLLLKEHDWDDYGALPCDKNTYHKAIKFLIDYSSEVEKDYNLIITEPEISLTLDGGIDLEWRSKDLIFLITFLPTEDRQIHYYGDDRNSGTIIKGKINYNSINKDLIFWMQKLS